MHYEREYGTGFCEHYNKASGSINFGELFTQLSDYQIIKNEFIPFSQLVNFATFWKCLSSPFLTSCSINLRSVIYHENVKQENIILK